MKAEIVFLFIDKFLISSKLNLSTCIILSLQQSVKVIKGIFASATVTEGCEEVKFHGIFPQICNCERNSVDNFINPVEFNIKSNKIHLFATVSHGCQGINILCNCDSWLQSHENA